MLEFLTRPTDLERRASLSILVTMRWVLIGAALFQVNYRPGTDAADYALLNVLVLAAAAFNGVLQWRLARHRVVLLYFPMLLAVLDAAAITAAVASVDGFDNSVYILYYPALLSFALVFPGKWSAVYTVALMVAYTPSATLGSGFDASSAPDQKALVLRLVTLAAVALTANLVVRVERTRRERAVAAEAERALEALAFEQRATHAERAAREERLRLSQEVHDGLSQNVYMLALGLEAAAETVARDSPDSRTAGRMQALVRLARQTLLETRNLLFDLERVMSGETSLAALVRNQAREFETVSGITAVVTVEGHEFQLAPAAVGEVFRVVQECLGNVFRHSGATKVTLALRYLPATLELSVCDSGSGFEPAKATGGHGLRNMRDRAARLGGELSIVSEPGAGSTVTVSIPCSEAANAPDPHPAR